MDDPVLGGGGFPEAVQVVQVAAVHGGADGGQGGRRRFGPGRANHLVSSLEQLGDDGRAEAELGVLAFKGAHARWADPTNQQELGNLARQSLQELQAASAALS